MNKRQTRIFAIAATAISALVFLGLTLDSHRQFGKLTNAEAITPAVTLGKAADKTIRLQLLGVDGLKDRVHRMATAGTLQFSETLPPNYWEMFAGEEIRIKYSRGFAIREWHQITGRRSEGLDCAVMALAAKHLINWQPDRRAEELASAAAPKKPQTVIRSKWLGG